MKILLCLNKDIFSNIALNLIAEALKEHEVNITYSSSVGRPENHLESFSLLENSLINKVVFPLIDKNNHLEAEYLSFDNIIRKYKFSCLNIEDINSDKSIAILSSYAPDVIISIRYGQILQDRVISLAKYAILNLHSGKLPEYAGVMAGFHAMCNDDKRLGMTLHYIQDKRIDAGDIIDIVYIESKQENSFFNNLVELYKLACPMLIKNLHKILKEQEVISNKQDLSQRSYYNYPSQEKLMLFYQKYLLITEQDICGLLKKYSQE